MKSSDAIGLGAYFILILLMAIPLHGCLRCNTKTEFFICAFECMHTCLSGEFIKCQAHWNACILVVSIQMICLL